MCCLTQNCSPSACPLNLTLIQECILRITSYKYSTLSPSYSLLFINHSNWEGMLWIEENTGQTIAVIPLSLEKLTLRSLLSGFLLFPKDQGKLDYIIFWLSSKNCVKEESLRKGVRSILPCRKNTFKTILSLCTREWQVCEFSGMLSEGQSFLWQVFLLHIISVSWENKCVLCAQRAAPSINSIVV